MSTWYVDPNQESQEFRFSGHTIGTERTGYSLIISVARFDSVDEAQKLYERIRDLLALDMSIDVGGKPN